VEVVVEVIVVGRGPLEVPTKPFLIFLYSIQARFGNCEQLDVAMLKVITDPVEIIGPEGTTRTTFGPIRPEHEVIDDQLAAITKQIRQSFLARYGVENIGLFYPDPGECTPLLCQSVAHPREFLLLGQMCLTLGQPLVERNYFVSLHIYAPRRI
jgi:hypothetical protein